MAFRVVTGLVGVFFSLQALQWIFLPEAAAEGLGMPLLDGVGRSTQVGDMTAFFLGVAAMIGIGVLRQRRTWLHAASLLLGGAAVGRTLAWAVHGADFATQFIAAEVIMVGMLLYAASKAPAES